LIYEMPNKGKTNTNGAARPKQRRQRRRNIQTNAGGGRRKERPANMVSGIVPGPMAVGVGAAGTNDSVGALRVRNKEFWLTLSAAATGAMVTANFVPGKSSMTVLDGIATVYDNYRVHKAQVFLVGTAATTSSTVANCCLDYEPGNVPTTQDQVLRTVPNVTAPAYRNATLVANKSSMNRRNWYITSAATKPAEDTTVFVLAAWIVGAVTEGFLVYCEYDVEFRNPSKAGA